jgi:hypothetical protein
MADDDRELRQHLAGKLGMTLFEDLPTEELARFLGRVAETLDEEFLSVLGTGSPYRDGFAAGVTIVIEILRIASEESRREGHTT